MVYRRSGIIVGPLASRAWRCRVQHSVTLLAVEAVQTVLLCQTYVYTSRPVTNITVIVYYHGPRTTDRRNCRFTIGGRKQHDVGGIRDHHLDGWWSQDSDASPVGSRVTPCTTAICCRFLAQICFGGIRSIFYL